MYNKWDIVLINFPFSDFTNFKFRPVLIWENLWEDFIVMPITSNHSSIFWEYLLKKNEDNKLKANSFLKPYNINTVDQKIIKWKLWEVSKSNLSDIKKIFCEKFCLQK